MLVEAAQGSPSAASSLLVPVRDQPHAPARALFAGQRTGGTLQPTASVHEAYPRLARQVIERSGRAQFLVIASKAMHCILVDNARTQGRWKRGGDRQRESPTVADGTSAPLDDGAVEAIESALREFAELDERTARLAERRLFGGLTCEQAVDVLGIARSILADDRGTARARLHDRLATEGG